MFISGGARPYAKKSNMFTSSEDVKGWATDAMDHCPSSHTQCQQFVDSEVLCLPTRLIDVGTTDEGLLLHLVTTKDLVSQDVQYLALSYCWGGDQDFKLSESTLEAMQKGFETNCLPKTIRDAVRIANWFNVRYLWVDALCIIQDNSVDWHQEAKTMDQVYRGAWLTIAAQGAKSSREGCFAKRSTLMHIPCELYEDPDGTTIFVEPINILERTEIDAALASPLCSRTWTVQERLLSPRILYNQVA